MSDLIARLRVAEYYGYEVCKESADALEAKDRRIAELEKMLAVHRLAVDVDALKARIAELEAENAKFRALYDEQLLMAVKVSAALG